MEDYRDFCIEMGCVHYNLIQRLESVENPNESIKRDLAIAKSRCEQRCERTAYDLYYWMKCSNKIVL